MEDAGLLKVTLLISWQLSRLGDFCVCFCVTFSSVHTQNNTAALQHPLYSYFSKQLLLSHEYENTRLKSVLNFI